MPVVARLIELVAGRHCVVPQRYNVTSLISNSEFASPVGTWPASSERPVRRVAPRTFSRRVWTCLGSQFRASIRRPHRRETHAGRLYRRHELAEPQDLLLLRSRPQALTSRCTTSVLSLGGGSKLGNPDGGNGVTSCFSTRRSNETSARVLHFLELTDLNGSGADRIVGAIRPGMRPGDAAYAAMT